MGVVRVGAQLVRGGFRSEVELAQVVIAYLNDLKYTVYQEVDGADIVAVLPNSHAWIIECKMGIGLGVLRQAHHWVQRGAAAFVSVATPLLRQSPDHDVAGWYLRYHGIGWLQAFHMRPTDSKLDYPVRELVPARFQAGARLRRKKGLRLWDIRQALPRDAEVVLSPAGSPNPKRWTPFKEFRQQVLNVLSGANEPMTTREIVDRVGKHHYSSAAGARSRLSHYLATGVIGDEVELVQEGRVCKWRLRAG